MLLVLMVVYQGKISADVARDLHRSKAWASDWLKRYDKEGLEGLKDRTKSGIKYHSIHIYRILRKWGYKQKVPRKIHVNIASVDEKEAFKKRQNRYLWMYGSSSRTRKQSL